MSESGFGAREVTVSVVQEIEALLAQTTRGEKAHLLQIMVRDIGEAFPGIESTPGVQGGDPCIVRTRIPVWVLEQARRLGVTEAELLLDYPSLRAADLVNAWAYVRAHRIEIDRQIEEQEAEDGEPSIVVEGGITAGFARPQHHLPA